MRTACASRIPQSELVLQTQHQRKHRSEVQQRLLAACKCAAHSLCMHECLAAVDHHSRCMQQVQQARLSAVDAARNSAAAAGQHPAPQACARSPRQHSLRTLLAAPGRAAAPHLCRWAPAQVGCRVGRRRTRPGGHSRARRSAFASSRSGGPPTAPQVTRS